MEPRDPTPHEPRAVPPREWQWLTAESDRWVRDGLIDAGQRERIVSRYAVDATAGQRRAFVILTGLGVLVAAIALLLVIGYNWDQIPRVAKVAMIFGAVTAAFAGSAAAYARGRHTAGELAAFAGTLLYGNAIWLLAQVYQIRAHYPNGALWWMIGALVAAHLLRSRLIAIEAVVLAGVWLVMEVAELETVNFLYVPFGVLTIWLAYRVESSWVLGLSAVVLTAWTFVLVATGWDVASGAESGRLAVGVTAMTACALYTAGFHHRDDDDFRRAWQNVGLVVLLVFLTALMTRSIHGTVTGRPIPPSPPWADAWPVAALAAGIALFAIIAVSRRWQEARRSWPLLMTLALSAGWVGTFLFAPFLLRAPWFTWAMTIAFSAATVSIGLSLIHAGMRENRGRLFAGGIGYVLVFLLVRWVDLLGSMLWSALFLAVTAAALFVLARLWLSRQPAHAKGAV